MITDHDSLLMTSSSVLCMLEETDVVDVKFTVGDGKVYVTDRYWPSWRRGAIRVFSLDGNCLDAFGTSGEADNFACRMLSL